jgi:hypothetical protein
MRPSGSPAGTGSCPAALPWLTLLWVLRALVRSPWTSAIGTGLWATSLALALLDAKRTAGPMASSTTTLEISKMSALLATLAVLGILGKSSPLLTRHFGRSCLVVEGLPLAVCPLLAILLCALPGFLGPGSPPSLSLAASVGLLVIQLTTSGLLLLRLPVSSGQRTWLLIALFWILPSLLPHSNFHLFSGDLSAPLSGSRLLGASSMAAACALAAAALPARPSIRWAPGPG